MKALIPERMDRGRLHYERIGPEHAAELETLLLDPRVYRTLHPGPQPPTATDVSQHARDKHEHWEGHGFGLWLLRERDGGGLIGRGGLQHTDAVDGAAVEVVWAVIPDRWGEGYATEIALASVEMGFDVLALDQLIAFTLVDNLASRRVMDKAGFSYARDIVHADLAHVLYTRARSRPTAGPDAAERGHPSEGARLNEP